MKINFSAVLRNLDGEPLMRQSQMADAQAQPMTLANAACDALIIPDSQQQSGDEKAAQFALAMKIVKGGEVEITPEQATLIKKRIGAAFGPLVVGRAYELLNG